MLARSFRLLVALLIAARAAGSSRSVTCVYACGGDTCGRLQRCLPHGASPSIAEEAQCVSVARSCSRCAPPPVCSPSASHLAVAVSNALGSSCTLVPQGTVLLTYTNAHHFNVLLFQRQVAADAGLACLLARTVTLCLDDECSRMCAAHRLPCVRYSAFTLGAAGAASDPTYRTITFVKWRILEDVLEHRSGGGGVRGALFFDDDVLLLANPFAAFDHTAWDVRHQAESGVGCSAQPNGGLLYVRATPAGRLAVRHMVAKQDVIQASGHKLDQDYVVGAVAGANATRCAFPKRSFAGHCPRAQLSTSSLRTLVTYHAHCCAPVEAKLALMARIVDGVARAPGSRLRAVDRAPLPAGVPPCEP